MLGRERAAWIAAWIAARSAGARLALGAVLAAAAAAAVTVALSLAMGSERYRVLARGVRMKSDVRAITGELDKRGIAYQLRDGGRTVAVPERAWNDAWQHASRERLLPAPGGRPGGQDWSSPGTLGFYPEAQRLQRLRGLEVELAKTISMYDPVEFARVHITQPRETVFGEERPPVTASLFLEMEPGRRLTPDQVAAIRSLVAHAVEGLSPRNITLCDSQGNEYSVSRSPASSAPVSMATVRELELTQMVESVVSGKVQDHLRRLFDPQAFVASVTVELEMTHLEVQPAASVVPGGAGRGPRAPGGATGGRAAARIEEDVETDGTASLASLVSPPQGEPGAPAGASSAAPRDLASSPRQDRILSAYRQVETRGRIRRLSLSVLLDARSLPGGALDAPLRVAVEEGLKAAVGFAAARGDTLSVVVAPFHPGARRAAPAGVAAHGAGASRASRWTAGGSPVRAPSAAPRALPGGGVAAPSAALAFVAAHFNGIWLTQVVLLALALALTVRHLCASTRCVAPGNERFYPVRLDQVLAPRPAGACVPDGSLEARLAAEDDSDLVAALARVDTPTLVSVLRASADPLRRMVLTHLPAQRARAIARAIAIPVPIAVGEVEEARRLLAEHLAASPTMGGD
jgi:flagellar M-ring protein FliF